MEEATSYIRFDWAMKRLLRNKASFVVLEGFLSTLLSESIHIEELLESESNQQNADDKYNRVDLLAKDSKGQYIVVEIQNTRESYYFHRMLYGTSKVITDNIKLGNRYKDVKKVYSVNIIYFALGTGTDYVYHGRTSFEGIHKHDLLALTTKQKATFQAKEVKDIFPEYYILRVDNFDQVAKTPLDEWIAYLKTGDIPENAEAQGLLEAREQLKINQMDKTERIQYNRHLNNVAIQMDTYETAVEEGMEKGMEMGIEKGIEKGMEKGMEKGLEMGMEKGMEKGILTVARNMKLQKLSNESISMFTGLTLEEIEKL